MNPTLRGFLIIALIATVVVVLQLERTLSALFILARIAFFLAIAYFLFLVWRDRRQEISTWSTRSRVVFYGAAALMVVNVAVRFWTPVGNGWNPSPRMCFCSQRRSTLAMPTSTRSADWVPS